MTHYTSINEAFHFSTTMPKQSSIKNTPFSLECIFCNSENTIELIPDGSFRRCLNQTCRKQFRAKMKPLQQMPKQPTTLNNRHPNEYIMYQQQHLLQQPGKQTPAPSAQEAPQYQQFSHPNYDPQIKYK